jgi:DNA-binding FadR family transcriptional regulator
MKPRKKFEEIAEHLELLIFSGKLKVDDKIPSERELMERFKVGRSSVREALFALQRKGLLTARAGTAARVSTPTADSLIADLDGAARHMLRGPEGMRHFQHARTLFEVGLARDAALHADQEDIAALAAALAANGAAEDPATFVQTDLAFHYTLAMIGHNPVFTALHNALTAWLAEQRTVSAKAGATRSEMYLQHKAIYDAIAAHDAVAAQAAMERHLSQVARYYWQAMTLDPILAPAGAL